MCKRTSCTRVHELPQNYCGDTEEGALFPIVFMITCMYYDHLTSVKFEYSFCRRPFVATNIYIYIYIYIYYIYIYIHNLIYIHNIIYNDQYNI